MEINLAVRKAYFAALSGNILNGVAQVPIFDSFVDPESTTYPYVILSVGDFIQRDVKRCKVYDGFVTVEVVTGSLDATHGRSEGENIAGQIVDIITPDDYVDIDTVANGYQVGDSKVISNSSIVQRSTPYYVFRQILRFEHIINKL